MTAEAHSFDTGPDFNPYLGGGLFTEKPGGLLSGYSISQISSVQTIPPIQQQPALQTHQQAVPYQDRRASNLTAGAGASSQNLGSLAFTSSTQSQVQGPYQIQAPAAAMQHQASSQQDLLYSYRRGLSKADLTQTSSFNSLCQPRDPLTKYLDSHHHHIAEQPRREGDWLPSQHFASVPKIPSSQDDHDHQVSSKRQSTSAKRQKVNRSQSRKASDQRTQNLKRSKSTPMYSSGTASSVSKRKQGQQKTQTLVEQQKVSSGVLVRKQGKERADSGQWQLYPPLNRSLSSYLNNQNGHFSSVPDSREASISKPCLLEGTNIQANGKVSLCANLQSLFQSQVPSQRNDVKKTSSKQSRNRSTPLSSTLKRSSTASIKLLQSTGKKSLRSSTSQTQLRSSGKLGALKESCCRDIAKYTTTNEQTLETQRKSTRSRCTACRSADSRRFNKQQSSASKSRKSLKSARSLKSTKSTKPRKQGQQAQYHTTGRQQLDKLRQRHSMLKQFEAAKQIAAHNDTKNGRNCVNQICRTEHFFNTRQFEDQNHTATFQGSHKVGQPTSTKSRRSATSQSLLDRQIVNILTNSHIIGQQKRNKRTLSTQGRSKSSGSLTSTKSKVKQGVQGDRATTPKRNQQTQATMNSFRYEPVKASGQPQQQVQLNKGPQISRFGSQETLQQQSQSSLAQTSSQQFLNLPGENKQSNQLTSSAMHNTQGGATLSQQALSVSGEPADRGITYYKSYLNTLGSQQQPSRLSPSAAGHTIHSTLKSNKKMSASQANVPSMTPYGASSNTGPATTMAGGRFQAGYALHTMSQTTLGGAGLDAHIVSQGVSDHAASLSTTKDFGVGQGPTHRLTPSISVEGHQRDNSISNGSLSRHRSNSKGKQNGDSQKDFIRVHPMPQKGLTALNSYSASTLNVESYLMSRSPSGHPTPTGQLSSRSVRQGSMVGLERSWNQVIDALESSNKRRIAHLRAKLGKLVDSNSSNQEGANAVMEKALLAREDGALSAPHAALEDLIQNGLNLDQERLINQLQAELSIKDKLKSDYMRLRHKYIHRKDQWAKQVQAAEHRAQSQRDDALVELQRQVAFYKSQTEDLRTRMRHDLKAKQAEFESAVAGSQNYRQALVQTETELRKAQDNASHLQDMLMKSDAEIDRHRLQLEKAQYEAREAEAELRKEAEQAVKEMKVSQKSKYRQQIEQLEAISQKNTQLRIEETRQTCQAMAQKDLEVQVQKFDLRLQQDYISISDHESIVRQIQLQERETAKAHAIEVQVSRDAQLTQVSNQLQEQAQSERMQSHEVIRRLEQQLRELQERAQREIEEKDKAWQEVSDVRTREHAEEARQRREEESELRAELQDTAEQNQALQAELQRLTHEAESKEQSFVAQEESLLKDIESLQGRLEEQFRVSEQLSEAQGSQAQALEQVKALQDQLRQKEQDRVASEAASKAKEAEIRQAAKDTAQLKKRITWVTSLKQSQIRSLNSDLHALKKQIQQEMSSFEAEFKQKSETELLRLAGQLQNRIHDKDSQLAKVSVQLDTALDQLEKSTASKDQIQADLLRVTEERETLKRDIEKLTSQADQQTCAQRKHASKSEREKAKYENELGEQMAKSERLEDRVANLNKIVDSLETQLRESIDEVDHLSSLREADLREHQKAMADKERKLQEFFCTKLDRKLTKMADEHRRNVADQAQSHEHQVVLFEQEYQAAQARIQELEHLLLVAEGRSQQQRQRTKEREALLRKQTLKIEHEVSKSIDKALGRSASRKAGLTRKQQVQGAPCQRIQADLSTPNLIQRQRQLALSNGSSQYGSRRLNNTNYQTTVPGTTEESPMNVPRVTKAAALASAQYSYGRKQVSNAILALSNETGQGLHMRDLELQRVHNSTASFIKPVDAYTQLQTKLGSSQRQSQQVLYRSKSSAGYHAVIPSQAHQSRSSQLLLLDDLERENLPPSQAQLLRKDVFNPLKTMKPYSTASQAPPQQPSQAMNQSIPSHYTQEAPSATEGQANLSRGEALSRSFEAKLLQDTSQKENGKVQE